MPGISPHVARFARWVREAGFTVYMPSLFGRDGAVPGAEEGAAIFQRACVSAEFRAMASNESSPVTKWLRSLARLAHGECGGRGVGAIGMCFTGNFALTMMLEPAMLAPVLSQPSLPLNNPAGIEIAPDEVKAVRERLEREESDRHGISLRERQILQFATDVAAGPVLPMHFLKGNVSLQLFTTIATLGTPQDITAQELRIESFFPMNDDTARTIRTWG
jgi:Dienelactone hydrolase family